jgi:hypothetical protein
MHNNLSRSFHHKLSCVYYKGEILEWTMDHSSPWTTLSLKLHFSSTNFLNLSLSASLLRVPLSFSCPHHIYAMFLDSLYVISEITILRVSLLVWLIRCLAKVDLKIVDRLCKFLSIMCMVSCTKRLVENIDRLTILNFLSLDLWFVSRKPFVLLSRKSWPKRHWILHILLTQWPKIYFHDCCPPTNLSIDPDPCRTLSTTINSFATIEDLAGLVLDPNAQVSPNSTKPILFYLLTNSFLNLKSLRKCWIGYEKIIHEKT